MRIATAFLVLAILFSAQNAKPNRQSAEERSWCDSAKTQQELNQCGGAAYRKTDARLNVLYSRLIASIQEDIATTKQNNDASQETHNQATLEKLRNAKRAWIRYRDVHCDAAKHRTEGGSMSPLVRANCMTETTNHRIAQLKHACEPPAANPEQGRAAVCKS